MKFGAKVKDFNTGGRLKKLRTGGLFFIFYLFIFLEAGVSTLLHAMDHVQIKTVRVIFEFLPNFKKSNYVWQFLEFDDYSSHSTGDRGVE